MLAYVFNKIKHTSFVNRHQKMALIIAIITSPIWFAIMLILIATLLLFYIAIWLFAALIVFSYLAIYLASFTLIFLGVFRIVYVNLFNGLASIGCGLIGVGITLIIFNPCLRFLKILYFFLNAPVEKFDDRLIKED